MNFLKFSKENIIGTIVYLITLCQNITCSLCAPLRLLSRRCHAMCQKTRFAGGVVLLSSNKIAGDLLRMKENRWPIIMQRTSAGKIKVIFPLFVRSAYFIER